MTDQAKTYTLWIRPSRQRTLKILAAQAGISMGEYLTNFIEAEAEKAGIQHQVVQQGKKV